VHLRKDRPYGIVYGSPYVAFEQDGHQFGPDLQSIDQEAVKIAADQAAVDSLEVATSAIEKVRLSRSEAIKAGIARKRALEQGA